jgi:hypothetical protein
MLPFVLFLPVVSMQPFVLFLPVVSMQLLYTTADGMLLLCPLPTCKWHDAPLSLKACCCSIRSQFPTCKWHAAPLSSPYLGFSMLLLYPLPLLGNTMLLVYPIPTWWRHTVPLSSPYL